MLLNPWNLLIMCNILAFSKTQHARNVGSVLFSSEDLEKKSWTIDEMRLLKARLYFQELLPPPLLTSTMNENNVDLMFNYFTEAYAAIKNLTNDSELDHLLTTALSDSIGGYLKSCVLPVTKLAFYSGTISGQNVARLFKLYDVIKRYLKTDGEGWHKPNMNLFDENAMRTKPKQIPKNAHVSNVNCDYSTIFFEKTSDDGLAVPIPQVSWDGDSSKMFLPLKNQSVYSMNSENTSAVLQGFYDTTKYCLQQYPQLMENFEMRFQAWLENEILPHMADDNIYLALGNVLTVLNKTRVLYDNLQVMYPKTQHPPQKRCHIVFFSKKVIIVSVLILIELFWCCLALIYTWHSRRKRDRVSNVYHFVERRPPKVQDKWYNTVDEFGGRPFGLKEDGINKSKKNDISATKVKTLFVRGRRSVVECKCSESTVHKTISAGMVTQDSSNFGRFEICNENVTKRNSSLSQLQCRSSKPNTDLPISTSKIITIGDTDRPENQRRSKHMSEQTHKIDEHMKKVSSQKKSQSSYINMEPRKSLKNKKSCSKNDAIRSECRDQTMHKKDSEEILKSYIVFPKAENCVGISVLNKKSIGIIAVQSEHEYYTTGTQNMPWPNKSSKILNTELSINHRVQHEECQSIEPPVKVQMCVSTVDQNMVKSIKFLENDTTDKNVSNTPCVESKIGNCVFKNKNVDVPKIPIEKAEHDKKETLINYEIINVEEKLSVNTYVSATSERNSTYIPEPNKIEEIICQNEQKANKEFALFPDKDCKVEPSMGKSEYIRTIASEPSTHDSLNISEPKGEVVPLSSCPTKKTQSNAETGMKHLRKCVYPKQPYCKITIDKPSKDVFIDIKGTIKINPKTQRSKIPKLSVNTILEIPASTNKYTAKSLIPQRKKKAVDDSVLGINKNKIKMNTTF